MHTLKNYDYHGLLASTWDLWRDDTANWSDRHYYFDIVREFGQPVLDVGCGTGRLILDFLQHGIDIDGIDNSPEMLAICRDKARALGFSPRLELGQIEHLDLPWRWYRTILLPSSILQLIPPDTAREALKRCFAHLEPGGAATTPFGFAWREGDPLDTGWKLLFEKPRGGDGVIVRSWTREWQEPEQQCWNVEQRFEIVADGKVIAEETHRRSPDGWWYTQDQARALFASAGFDSGAVHLHSGFSRTPATPDDRLFTGLCVKGTS